jgi:NAD/NADP transhydrogenase alpha subunit
MLYARNVQHLVNHLWKDAGLEFDFEDEIVSGTTILHRGQDRRESAEPVAAGGGA